VPHAVVCFGGGHHRASKALGSCVQLLAAWPSFCDNSSLFCLALPHHKPYTAWGPSLQFAQDDSDFFGESLHLFKVASLSNDTYLERYVHTLEPSGTGNWYSARTHHMDIQPVSEGSSYTLFTMYRL
jgi:hypothetical protein